MRIAVPDVLEDIEAEDEIERGVGERQRHARYRLDRQLAVPMTRVGDQRWIDLDTACTNAVREERVQHAAVPVPNLEGLGAGVRAAAASRKRRFASALPNSAGRPIHVVRSQQQKEALRRQSDEGERQQAWQAMEAGELAEIPRRMRIAAAAEVLDVHAVVHERLRIE